MEPVELYLDQTSPIHEELEAGLREELSSLETISFRTVTRPAPPGTLTGGAEQAVSFVIGHYDTLIPLATALLTIASQLLARYKRQPPASQQQIPSPIVIVIGEHKLPLPATR